MPCFDIGVISLFALDLSNVFCSTHFFGVCVCLQEDLSVPLLAENLDGSSGVLFPFYDPDTHMLYLAGKVTTQNHPKKTSQ